MTTLFVAAHDEKTKRTKEPFEQQQRKRMYSKKLRSASGLLFRSPLHHPYSLFSSPLKKKKRGNDLLPVTHPTT